MNRNRTQTPRRSPLRALATTLGVALLCVAALPVVAPAQPVFPAVPATGPSNKPELWQLTVRARAAVRPVLAHPLLTPLSERVPGNAAPMYMIAISEVWQTPKAELPPDHPAMKDRWPGREPDLIGYLLDEIPLAQLRAGAAAGADADRALHPSAATFQSFDAATRREFCRWDLPVREYGFETLLPHLNGSRQLARSVALRSRIHLARGEYARSADVLRGVFQLGHDVAEEGLLIQSLVGAGIASVGAERLREFVQQPDAPNLYWSVAALPRPFVDLREAMEWERVGMLATFPQLKKPADEPWTAADWEDLFKRLTRYTQITGDARARGASAGASLGPAAAGAVLFPAAKRYLIERRGMTAEQVDAMPVPQVLGQYLATEYRTWFDEMQKWAGLPFWQAAPGMRATEEEFRKASAASPARWLLSSMPAVFRAGFSLAQLDRQLAAIQTVEALRAYAASHDGKLPAALEELTDTPAPLDPTTGKPFVYRVDAGTRATLESPAPPGQAAQAGLRVELTIVK